MAFVRIKEIKNKSGNKYKYAYLVENKWRKRGAKGSRQKVKGYLGKVHKFDDSPIIFDKQVEGKEFSEIVRDLVEWELRKKGFEHIDKGLMKKGDFEVDILNKKFMKDGKSIVIQSHDGYMCDVTLKKLLKFGGEGEQEDVAYSLANAIVEAGINVPKDVFVEIFEKIYK